MSPRTVAIVLKGSAIAGVIIIFLMIIMAISGEITANQIFWGIGLFLFCLIFDLIFVFSAPVRCDQENCHEIMHRAWVNEGGFQYRLTYECSRCGYIYDTNFTFGFGETN